MTSGQIEVRFTCKACGKKLTELSLPDDATDDSIATCTACGAEVGSWGAIKAGAKAEILEKMKRELHASFKGMKGFKPGR